MVPRKPRFGGGTQLDHERSSNKNRNNTTSIFIMADSLSTQDCFKFKMENQEEQVTSLHRGGGADAGSKTRVCDDNAVRRVREMSGAEKEMERSPLSDSEIKDECEGTGLNAFSLRIHKTSTGAEERHTDHEAVTDTDISTAKEEQHGNDVILSCCPISTAAAYPPNSRLLVEGCEEEEESNGKRIGIGSVSESTDLSGVGLTNIKRTNAVERQNATSNDSVVATGSDRQKESTNGTINDCDVVATTKQVDTIDSLARIIDLLEIFKIIGFAVRAKVYTKLDSRDKHYWTSYFKNNIEDELLSTLFEFDQHSVTHQKVDPCEVDVDVMYCKNLFLKDRKGQFYLLIADESCIVDLKELKEQLNASRNLSFANNKSMERILKSRAGEVTPFAITHESARDVRVIFHESLTSARVSGIPLAFHPFSPVLQVDITFQALSAFVSHHGKELEILDSTKSVIGQLHDDQESEIPTMFTKEKRISCTESTKQMIAKPNLISPQPLDNFGDTGCPEEICVEVEDSDTKPSEKYTEEKALSNDNASLQKDTSVEFLAEPEGYGDKQIKTQRLGKIQFNDYDRKGKLKSLIRKNDERRNDQLTNHEHCESSTNKDGASTTVNIDTAARENTFKTDDDIIITVNNSDSVKTITDLDELSPKTTLPEIEEFYNVLLHHQIHYNEMNTGGEHSGDMGPALGVKCFLLKDKRHNYFFVISHELYEPDYGRLKKCLRPKKKLEVCDVEDYMDVLGVDRQQFTPFAIMNERAKRNDINVFFTEKIMKPNIVLCMQHPYCCGVRLLMTSSELQRFLVNFAPNDIGSVEEKVWVEKYNTLFSQFNRDSSHYRVNQHFHQKEDKDNPQAVVSQNDVERLKSEEIVFAASSGGASCKKGAEEKDINTKYKVIDNPLSSKVLRNLFAFSNCVLRYLGVVDRSSPVVESGESGECGECGEYAADEGTSVDIEEEGMTDQESATYDKKKHQNDDIVTDKGTSVLTYSDGVIRRDDNFQINRLHDENDFWETCCISKNSIKEHLDENDVEYAMREKIVSDGGNTDFDDHDDDNDNDNDNENENENVSQICTTLHLTDETDSTHYVVVGRKSEHVSIKRFRRRFQISKRLFFVISENQACDNGGKTTLPFTTPFDVILANEQDQVVCKVGRGVKYKVVLYNSIYMDPEMECVFELDTKGTRLSMSSQEFENYCKRIGMEVWYMP